MATTEELKHKIATANDLRSVVKTMKALAAVSIRQYEKAAESLTEYDRALELGLQILLAYQQGELLKQASTISDRCGVVVFGSDWGMCGQFNERVVSHTQAVLRNLPISPQDCSILAVGSRVSDRLTTAGLNCETYFTLPSSVGGITAAVREIVLILERWQRENKIQRIVVIYNRLLKKTKYRPTNLQIFPLDSVWLDRLKRQKWSSRSLPTFTMERDKLATALFRQYFFVSLYRGCVESLKCENSSRLATMQMAEKNIVERLTELSLEFNHQRQTTITEELLDIILGFEAITATNPNRETQKFDYLESHNQKVY